MKLSNHNSITMSVRTVAGQFKNNILWGSFWGVWDEGSPENLFVYNVFATDKEMNSAHKSGLTIQIIEAIIKQLIQNGYSEEVLPKKG